MKAKIIASVISGIVVIAAAIGGWLYFTKPEEKVETTTAVETTTEDPYAGMKRSYLTGEYKKEKIVNQRAYAFMYNNIQNAIPQSGIGDADVLYEAPVEGGITRLMGLFDNVKPLKKMGSVRSCRIYYARFAMEWDAIYCHYGQSKYAKKLLKSNKIDNLCSWNAESGYYRINNGKALEHTCFADGKKLMKAAKKLKYRKNYKKDHEGHFTFVDIDKENNLDGYKTKVANRVDIGYNYNNAYYTYNDKDKKFYRYQYGEKHIDDQKKAGKNQLKFTNIVIQFVDATLYPDNKSLDMTLTGKGKGWLVTRGKATKITWEKKRKNGQTKYYYKDGSEIALNNGKTCIQIVLNEYQDNVKFSKKAK